MNLEDTIAAIATAMGPAGIGVIRMSGTKAIDVAQALFHPSREGLELYTAPSHRLYHGWIRDEGQPVDEVLLTLMKAPHSYTTEDVVEIQCHGSVMVLQTVLQLILNQGVRLAQPGEFTQRAFFLWALGLDPSGSGFGFDPCAIPFGNSSSREPAPWSIVYVH